jgi:1,4-dihydroxy-2-naphthoate octaprenyltransferase
VGGKWSLLRVIRLPILLGGALGYGLGALLGLADGGVFNPILLSISYSVVALGDLSTHFSNDYFDVELDRSAPKKIFGGSNLLVSRTDLLLPALGVAKILSLFSLALAGLAMVLGVSPLIVPLAFAANILGWLYSLPPFRLAYHGLGETAIAVGTGFGVPAAGYLTVRGSLDAGFMLCSVALVLYGFVLGLSLELPDTEADRVGGKMNLVVRFGWRNCLRLALLLCLASTLILALFRGTIMAVASVVPLTTVFFGNFLATENRSRQDIVATACILSLFIFLIASVGSLAIN